MSENEEEGELDPAMERVRRKLVRLLIVSSGIMVIGFAAVIIGIFYRVSQMNADAGPSEPVALGIAADDLSAATVADGKLILTVRGERPRIEVRELDDGAIVGVFTLDSAAGQ